MEIWMVTFTYLFLILLNICDCAVELDESEDGSFLFVSAYEDSIADDSKNTGKGGQCQDDKLMAYLGSIQVINPESVIALATENKLEKVCANTSKTVDHMKTYLKSCVLQPGQNTYTHLLGGISTLHKKLCSHDQYRKTFMEFKNCYSQLQSEFDSCNGPADWSDSSNIRLVCKAYQEIADCYYIKTSVLCGNKAADVFKELVNAVVDSVITVDCSVSALEGLGKINMNKIGISSVVHTPLEYSSKIVVLSVLLLQIYELVFPFYLLIQFILL